MVPGRRLPRWLRGGRRRGPARTRGVSMGEVLWRPDPGRAETTRIEAFRREAERRWGRALPDWAALHAWSIDAREEFWTSVWEFCEVRATRPWDRVLDQPDAMPGSVWFPGAELNFAENLLARTGSRPAIIATSEATPRRELSWDGLHREVARCAAALAGLGVGRGDRVAGLLPNGPEAVIAMLATASLGAVWSSCSPDFGAQGVRDRFGQIEPRVLIACDGYVYAGKRCDVLPTVAGLQRDLPSLAATIIVPFMRPFPDLSGLARRTTWETWLDQAPDRPLAFEPTPFDHPLYILYSSGTTGLPKCMVHSVGGTLLQHLKEHRLHTD
ncbi:AMP-binding protein, partial [bacterium]|nr:AMP-binding protein [bacterium]